MRARFVRYLFRRLNPGVERARYAENAILHPCFKWMASNPNYKAEKSEYDRQYRARKPDKRKHSKLAYNYGISLEQYNELLKRQDGVCAICKLHPTKKALCVDHNHQTGQIRGLLCARHNSGIGYFDDSPDLLRAAKEYLRDRKTVYKVRTA